LHPDSVCLPDVFGSGVLSQEAGQIGKDPPIELDCDRRPAGRLQLCQKLFGKLGKPYF
jgi:hypothetical protein